MQVVVQPGGIRQEENQDPNAAYQMPNQQQVAQPPQMQNPQMPPQQQPAQYQQQPQYQQPQQQPQTAPFPQQAQVAPPQPQMPQQVPQQNYQQPQQQPQQQGGNQYGGNQNRGQSRPIMKLPTRSGLPVQSRNEVLLEGYFNNPKLSTVSNGSQRIGFDIVVEAPIFQAGGQPKIDPNTGQQASRDVRYRCQAWGQQAVQLAQYPEGTPLRISGALNRWSVQNGGRFTWYTDVKVLQSDPL